MAAKRAKVDDSPRVRIHVEAQVPAPSPYTTVASVRSVISGLYSGQYSSASLLVDQMWQNPRLRVAMATRLAGLTGAEVRWLPANESADAKKAADAMRSDWHRIAPTASRKQYLKWGLMLGDGFAQPAWFIDEATGRRIPRIMPWHPYSVDWYDNDQAYRIRPNGKPVELVKSPSLVEDGDLNPRWIVHEPFGPYGYREGYALSAWYAWLGNELGRRDMLRVSEKVGQGIVLLNVPHNADTQAALAFRDGWRNMGAGAAVPCEEMEDGRKFDAKPFEWNAANGFQVVDSTLANTAADLVILFLGGNLQTEVKGGGSYAAVVGQSEVRSDYIDDDAKNETDTLARQAFRPWALANFGDPSIAPIREVVTDPPAKDAAAATMAGQLAQALDSLVRHGVDARALLERFRLPLSIAAMVQVDVPAPVLPDAAEGTTDAPDATAQADGPDMPQSLDITPTDRATYVKVDEARKSDGLEGVGGEVGDRWIAEHSAKIRAEAAPEIAIAAKAESGAAPGAPMPRPFGAPSPAPDSPPTPDAPTEPQP